MTTVRAAARSDESRWATLDEAATYAKIRKRTLRQWIADGLLPAYRMGPHLIQIDLNDIDRLRTRIPAVASVLADDQDA
jgi:excisionase family DNA binding protein